MYTEIIQNTKFVYILYTKIAQIKIFYDKCTRNLHQIPTYIQKMYKLPPLTRDVTCSRLYWDGKIGGNVR